MKKNTVLQRLKIFLDEKSINNRQFEIKIGVSNGSFSSQLKNNKTIGSDKIENVLNIFPDLNANWLFRGIGNMYVNLVTNIDHDDILTIKNENLDLLQENRKLYKQINDLRDDLDKRVETHVYIPTQKHTEKQQLSQELQEDTTKSTP